MSLHRTKPEHEAAYQDIVALLNKYAGKLTAQEMLAVAANLVGKLVAMQDQRVMTRDMALEIVLHNLEHGNKQVVEELMQSKGRA